MLVEEPSMEAFLRQMLSRLLGESATFNVYPYQGKDDLLSKLQSRLQGYSSWLPENWRVVVVVDRDDADCEVLKNKMEQAASNAGLRSRNVGAAETWQVVNRIAIEELEAWYFGDWDAVRKVYPKVPATIPQKEPYRNPDNIQGGTWEAFERVLQRVGYFKTGLRKMEVARDLGKYMDPAHNCSRSFAVFRDAVLEAVA
ncbi:MAG: DUF4276 family protein [Pantoea agglomerans]